MWCSLSFQLIASSWKGRPSPQKSPAKKPSTLHPSLGGSGLSIPLYSTAYRGNEVSTCYKLKPVYIEIINSKNFHGTGRLYRWYIYREYMELKQKRITNFWLHTLISCISYHRFRETAYMQLFNHGHDLIIHAT